MSKTLLEYKTKSGYTQVDLEMYKGILFGMVKDGTSFIFCLGPFVLRIEKIWREDLR